ncbi:MAG: DUF6624 domain-containing protein [Cytophagales bacterium]|nr:DUF6624 domain-containing protein [Cytophagales bacterium]
MVRNKKLAICTIIMIGLIQWSCSSQTSASNDQQVRDETRFPEAVIHELENMYDDDQFLRFTEGYIEEWLNELRETKGEDDPTFQLVAEKHKMAEKEFTEQDEKNAKRLDEIFGRYGWPDRSVTSRMANKTAFLIVQHNFEIQEKYLPVMLESAKKGETPAGYVAYLQDRILMKNGEPQLYGSQMLILNGEQFLWPIADMEKVNERRKEMGLSTLEEAFDGTIPEVLEEGQVTFSFK